MGNKRTQEETIAKFREIHGSLYDYSKVEYNGALSKVIIICNIHKEFTQTPNKHILGHGCPKCGLENRVWTKQTAPFKYTTNTFIIEANMVHNYKYDYSKTEYLGSHQKVCIICPIHKEFWQDAKSHLAGFDCAKCATERRANKQRIKIHEFIKESNLIWNNKYDYSLTNVYKVSVPVQIICPLHGEFSQQPRDHLKGVEGCKECYSIAHRKDTETFILDAIKVHGNIYDYKILNIIKVIFQLK